MKQMQMLEQERDSDRVAYENRYRRLNDDMKEREGQLETKHIRKQSDALS